MALILILLIYLAVLFTGLVLYGRRKSREISRPLYLKFFSFSVITVGMLLCLIYAGAAIAFVFGIIALAALYEVFMACRSAKEKLVIFIPALVVISLFLASSFTIEIPFAGLFLCVLSFDAFSQFTGQLIGKTPLCTSVSPNKTIEGTLGGLCMCVLTSFFAFHSLFAGLIISATSLSGDLLASLIKRRAGIKDFSRLLPGQGGVLDRFDSFIFTCALYSIYVLCQKFL